jgi:predicted DNA-binding ribbon-helix-helix protein
MKINKDSLMAIRLTAKQYKKIKEIAMNKKMTVSQLIREQIDQMK